jgi:hypothetical protein
VRHHGTRLAAITIVRELRLQTTRGSGATFAELTVSIATSEQARQIPPRRASRTRSRWSVAPERAAQECGHLLAGDERGRAVPAAAAPGRDPRLGDEVDVRLVQVAVVVGESIRRGATQGL